MTRTATIDNLLAVLEEAKERGIVEAEIRTPARKVVRVTNRT